MYVYKKEPLSIPYTMWKKTQNGLDLNVKPKTTNILKKASEIHFFFFLLYHPAIPSEIFIHLCKYLCRHKNMYTNTQSELFIITPDWKQLKYPSTGK